MNSFARRVFSWAGIYGLLVLTPQYFAVDRIGRDTPPPVTHQEYFYGFIGIAIAWQVCFLVISREPARFRPLMLAAVLEKLAFGIPVLILYARHELTLTPLVFGLIDLMLGILFVIAYYRTSSDVSRASFRR